MTIIDMGLYFDGKCAICRDWIKPYGDMWSLLATEHDGVRHRIAHSRCLPAERALELYLLDEQLHSEMT